MTSRESDLADWAAREQYVDRNLAEARAGRDRLRAMADEPAPEREDQHRGTPNSYPGDRP
jgi:hypothetical protein